MFGVFENITTGIFLKKYNRIYIACDHAGLALKQSLMKHFRDLPWQNLGTDDPQSVDYPDFADLLAKKLALPAETDQAIGVLICGSGQGMAIKANRFDHIRAALCYNSEHAKMARAHNDANVLCLGARFVAEDTARDILQTFLDTSFEGGRHNVRVAKLSKKNGP